MLNDKQVNQISPPQFNPDGSLQGTMVKEPEPKPTTFSPINPPALPQARQGSTDAFSSVMRKVSKLSAVEQLDPLDILNQYKEAGVDISGSPEAVSTAISTAQRRRIPFIEDTFKSAVELITKQEKQRADYQKQLMDVLPKEAISLMLQRGQIGDLQQLSDGKTPDSLIQAMKDLPKETPKVPSGIVGEYQFYAQQEKEAKRKPLSFNEYQTMDANRKRSVSNTYIQGGLTKDQFTRLNVIADNMRQDPNIKDFVPIRSSYETARAGAEANNSAGDIVLMRMLAKITDPTTGVREEEYRTFQGAVGTLPQYGIKLTKQMLGTGQLTNEGRKRLLQQVENIYNQRKVPYLASADFYKKQAEKAGGTFEDVMPTYLAPDAAGTTPKPRLSSQEAYQEYLKVIKSKSK